MMLYINIKSVYLAIFYVLMSLLVTANATKFVDGTFKKVLSGGLSLEKSTSQPNVQIPEDCAILCMEKRVAQRVCRAFHYNPLDRTCDLYSHSSTAMPSPGIWLFKLNLWDVFHTIYQDGKYYSIYASSVSKNFTDARTDCGLLGGFLFEFDSLANYEALKMVVVDHRKRVFWVGASDVLEEGVWRTEKDGLPIDTDIWLWTRNNPDNYGHRGEDCMIFNKVEMGVGDVGCAHDFPYLCERSVRP